jgi:hypothetical protein
MMFFRASYIQKPGFGGRSCEPVRDCAWERQLYSGVGWLARGLAKRVRDAEIVCARSQFPKMSLLTASGDGHHAGSRLSSYLQESQRRAHEFIVKMKSRKLVGFQTALGRHSQVRQRLATRVR